MSFFIIIFGSINAFICIHIFIGNQSYPNWLVAMDIHDSPFIQIYIAALYGIIETLTTVGYGDVVVNSFTEYCFQIVLLSYGKWNCI
jgi:voltage-gated potassium channel Kch